MALSNNAMESILKAMDIIADNKVNKVSYDSTAICTIVDDSDKKNGCYIVTDGTINFKAYSEVTDYKVNEQVRVSIPNGDYSQDKYIEGRYVTDNNTSPITYVSPLDSVINMENLLDNTQTSVIGSLIANKVDITQPTGVELWTKTLSDRDLQESGIYSTIFLQADFRSLLNNKQMRGGTFGLRLDLMVRTNSKNYPRVKQSLYLDSSEMFGNPYSFTVYTTQAKKFDISKIGVVEQITLYFYQNNDFIYYNGKEVVTLPVEDNANLFVKNIGIGFGSDVSAVTDNTIQLYSSDSMDFKHFEATDESNTKTIGFLWYNKNDLNQYVGFSDGIVDVNNNSDIIDYDEINYLTESKANARLVAQKGKDVPTDETGLGLSADIEEAVSALKEASKLITSDLTNTLKGFKERIAAIKAFNIQQDYINSLEDIANKIDDIQEDAVKYYTDGLSRGAKIQKRQHGEDIEIPAAPTLTSTLTAQVIKIFNDLHNKFYNVNFDAEIDRDVNFITSYKDKIEQSYQGFKGIYDTYARRVSKIFQKLEKLLNQLKNNFTNENKVAAYSLDNIIVDYIQKDFSNYDNRYCVYWYRYVKGYHDEEEPFMDKEWQRLNEFNNTGLPSGYTLNGTIHYLNKKPDADEGTVTIFLDPELKEEKFAVVVIYNHEVFKSGELVFNNTDTFDDPTTVDKADALYIEHSDNSLETYQYLYNSTNFLNNSKDSKIIRKLKVRYDGLLHKDEMLIGAQVYWYVPNHTTMLAAAAEKLTEAGFMSDAASAANSEYYRNGYTCFYKQIKTEDDTYFYYRIKDYYTPTFSRNTIFCHIEKDEYPFEADITMTFGIAGTSGTDYTLMIVPSTAQTAIIGEKSLPLDITLYDYDNKPIPMYNNKIGAPAGTAFNTRVKWMGPTAYTFNLITKEDNSINGAEVIYNKGSANYYGIAEVITSFQLGAAGNQEEQNNIPGKRYRQVDLTALYPVAWSAGDYYIEGATSIVYDSNGRNPNYYKNPYRIFYANTDIERTDVSWQIKYFIGTTELTPDRPEYAMYMSYLPVVNDKNGLTPCNMYISGIDCYPVVQCFDQDGSLIWSQPIVIIQNRYPSTMLNSWDGSLTIDEKNGTILSTMVGAGRKTANNTFEGVLMGDVAIGAGIDTDNKSGLGLYGFHDGAQSFGLNIDGTAFFGKSGRGRIEINGDKGTISSASYQQNNSAGMMIDFDDGFINIRGTAQDNNGNYIPDEWSQIRIDVKSPYFQIISQAGHKIIQISKDEYFLQSDNYTAGTFNTSDGVLNSSVGQGMKIDLWQGIIDAYYLKITSKNLLIDSSIKGNNRTPFFIIKSDNGKNLIYASGTEFYIQSNNCNLSDSGMKIDLSNGKIWAANFELKGGNRLELNSTPDTNTDYYFKIGDINGYHISFTRGGFLDLNVLDINLNAKYIDAMTEQQLNKHKQTYPNSLWLYIKDQDTAILNKANESIDLLNKALIEKEKNINQSIDKVRADINTTLNATIGQDRVDQYWMWNRLTDGGNKLGIFPIYEAQDPNDKDGTLEETEAKFDETTNKPIIKELYINATWISAGVLKSKNVKILAVGKIEGNGVYFDLDNGLLYANQFNLIVQGEKTIKLSSTPTDDGYYFYIGNKTGYIGYDKNDKISIVPQEFYLNASNAQTKNGLVINSNPEVGENYFYVGNATHHIYYNQNGELQLATNRFTLDAAKHSESKPNDGLYFNSHPTADNDPYMYVGNSTNGYITLNNEGKLKMYLADFDLGVVTEDGTTISLSSTPKTLTNTNTMMPSDTKAYFFIGKDAKNCMYFDNKGDLKVTGDIYANNGSFNGTITANNGSIGTWKITSSGLYGITENASVTSANPFIWEGTTYTGSFTFETFINTVWTKDNDKTVGSLTSDNWRFLIQVSNNKLGSKCTFGITREGYLAATHAYINGTINADSGRIGGWDIGTFKSVNYSIPSNPNFDGSALMSKLESTGNTSYDGQYHYKEYQKVILTYKGIFVVQEDIANENSSVIKKSGSYASWGRLLYVINNF